MKNIFWIKVSKKIFDLILKKNHCWSPSRAICQLYKYGADSNLGISEVVLAEISPRSPRKLFIFIMCKNIFWIKVSKKLFNLILKKTSLLGMQRFRKATTTCIRVKSGDTITKRSQISERNSSCDGTDTLLQPYSEVQSHFTLTNPSGGTWKLSLRGRFAIHWLVVTRYICQEYPKVFSKEALRLDLWRHRACVATIQPGVDTPHLNELVGST